MRASAVVSLVVLVGCGDEAGNDMDASVVDATTLDASDASDASWDAGVELPERLSETGLYTSDTTLAVGVREYGVRFPLWTDGLDKRRFIAVPSREQIDTTDPDEWIFPVGTKLWKEFSLEGTRLETRLFEKVAPDTWGWVAYVWRADASDADAAPAGVVDVAGTFHDVPEADRCFGCHRGVVDRVLGVSAFELATADFERFVADGLLDAGAVLFDPPGDELESATLGALHANCGHCHSERHPLAMSRALRLRLQSSDTLATTGLYRTAIGATAAHVFDDTDTIVVPGEPDVSQLYLRPARRGDEWQMPPFGSEQVDADLVDLLERFISVLDPSP